MALSQSLLEGMAMSLMPGAREKGIIPALLQPSRSTCTSTFTTAL
ncbi:hypothetical protein NSU_3226 [Novosphingobium pentaromativorans US6-1]|uniref:Uncharacterized protein n=1 Tax=Novosphingobium pentaromativorans US6-1 TaxID=1088721 RepID=G6EFV6_9SPHN|nr:hypothetical protein NSU_3226 [Novosphingobium pentaromativorans US6-1]